MLIKKNVIAICHGNFFLEEISELLIDEGFSLTKLKGLCDIKLPISDKIILINIKSKLFFNDIRKLINIKLINCRIFVNAPKRIIDDLDLDGFDIIAQPMNFKDFKKKLSQVSKIDKKKESYIKIGNFFYNFKKSQLVDNANKKSIELTELENNFLKFFIKSRYGHSKAEILKEVWGHNKILETHTLESLIYRLRKKIEKNPNEPQIITLINKKYFLNLD
tara:strand:- start:207 stop:866 length:660 start_codon:yes stop_codon:yes gene_type:complete